MHEGQERFYYYYLNNVKAEFKEDAKSLLEESFKRQQDGNFNQKFVDDFIIKTKLYINEDKLEELLKIIKQFTSNLY